AGQRGPAQQNLTQAQRNKFYLDEGVLAVIEHGSATGGNLTVQGGGDPAVNAPPVPVQVVVAVENYGLMYRNLENNVPVTFELNVENKFYDQDLNAFNVIGEIPGTDKASEVVMLGAHFDSWHASTGATDNGAGSAAMMEAMRILKQSGVRLRRTVRIGLWTGEEQGLLGSRDYVSRVFGANQNTAPGQPPPTPRTPAQQAAWDKFAAYFNIDNGTGSLRGVYLQGNQAVAPIFREWMEPFHILGMKTLNLNNTGGTDHQSFDGVNLPGFQFIQDEIEYDTMTHHTNLDSYERIQPEDMRRMSTIAAAFAFMAANREEKLPRKPVGTSPFPGRGGRGGQ